MENQNTLVVEIIAVLKESLRKQAFSVILLLSGVSVLWTLWKQDRSELIQDIVDLKADIRACNAARERQSQEILVLQVRIARLEKN